MSTEPSETKRKEAHILLLRNDSDIQGTKEQLLQLWASDPVVARATNKEKLIENILLCRGDRYNRRINLHARAQASSFLRDEEVRKAEEKHTAEANDLKQKITQLERDLADERILSTNRQTAVDKVREAKDELQEKVDDLREENSNLRLNNLALTNGITVGELAGG